MIKFISLLLLLKIFEYIISSYDDKIYFFIIIIKNICIYYEKKNY